MEISKEPGVYGSHSQIMLTFRQKLTVTKYFFPEFSIAEFLSSMGGALGLWLGLGVLQLATNIVMVAKWLESYF